MLIAGIATGLIAGLLAGGDILNLARIRLRWIAVILVAVTVRFGTEAAINAGSATAEMYRVVLFVGAYGLLLVGLWANRSHPGMSLAFVGILFNAVAVAANAGRMPIWEPSLLAAGFASIDAQTAFHTLLPPALDATFILHAGPLADVIPIPVPILRNVASVGDLFLTAGLGFFLFSTVVRIPRLGDLTGVADAFPASRVPAETGLAAGLVEAASLERSLVLGGAGAGLSSPSLTALADDASAVPIERPRLDVPTFVGRLRRHPYIRLALDGSFSALWVGQVISLLGDRIHQIALTFLVLDLTDSPIALGAVLVAATLPNLLLGPIAGTFVDRWDHRQVMIVSDLLRGALVLLLPVVATSNFVLVYPLVFLITTVSIFFRPARVAIMPRIVAEDDLLAANSAMWIGDTIADIAGYPLAGLFVWFLGTSLPLAFWVDAVSYVGSAVLIATVVVRPAVAAIEVVTGPGNGLRAELLEGWRFLRGEAVLFANTLQAIVAQLMLGVLLTLLGVYAKDVVRDPTFGKEAVLAFLEGAIGLGNLIGGFAVGLIGARIGLGRMVIVGYAMIGAFVAALGLTEALWIAAALLVGAGIGNLIFIIPSQTLFQQRTPARLMGRVVSLRYAMTFGSMTLAIAVGGVLGEVFGAPPVLTVFGVVTLIAGLAGLLVPAVRDA